MIASNIVRYVIGIPNNITKTKFKTIEFIGGIAGVTGGEARANYAFRNIALNTLIGWRGSGGVEEVVIKLLTNTTICEVCTFIAVRKITKHTQTRIISN